MSWTTPTPTGSSALCTMTQFWTHCGLCSITTACFCWTICQRMLAKKLGKVSSLTPFVQVRQLMTESVVLFTLLWGVWLRYGKMVCCLFWSTILLGGSWTWDARVPILECSCTCEHRVFPGEELCFPSFVIPRTTATISEEELAVTWIAGFLIWCQLVWSWWAVLRKATGRLSGKFLNNSSSQNFCVSLFWQLQEQQKTVFQIRELFC